MKKIFFLFSIIFFLASVTFTFAADIWEADTNHGGTFQVVTSPWPMFHHDAQHTGRSPYSGPQYNSTIWTYTTGGEVNSSPAIDKDGTVYVGSEDHKLYAINPNGTLKWTFPTGEGIYASPAIGEDGTIYVGSEDHKLYAINPDGTSKWTYPTGGAIYSSPTIGYDGAIYFGSQDGKLYALYPDGTLKGVYTADGTVDTSPAIGSDGILYVGTNNYNRLCAINPDFTLKWKTDPHANVISSPALNLDGTVVYYGSDDGFFYARNTSDGSLKWKSPPSYGGIRPTPAIGSDGTVYVGTMAGYLWALNPEDGSFKWDIYTTLSVWSSPAIGADGTIYFATDYGVIYAMNPDGTIKWIYNGNYDDGHFHSSPAIGSNGALYVGSTKNKLYAFGKIATLVLTPDNTTVSRGGTLGIQVTVTNNSSETQTIFFATNVTLPNGTIYPPSGYLFGPYMVTLYPYQSKSGHISHTIPGNAPLGIYTYRGYIAKPGTDVIDESHFNFEVIETTGVVGPENWQTMVDRNFIKLP